MLHISSQCEGNSDSNVFRMDLRSLFWHHHYSFSIPEANHHSFLSCDFFFPYQCAKERQLPTSGDRSPLVLTSSKAKFLCLQLIGSFIHRLWYPPSLVYPSLCSSPYSGSLSLSILTTISSFWLIWNCEQHYIHGNSLLLWAPLEEAESWWSMKLVESLDNTAGIRDQAWMCPGGWDQVD